MTSVSVTSSPTAPSSSACPAWLAVSLILVSASLAVWVHAFVCMFVCVCVCVQCGNVCVCNVRENVGGGGRDVRERMCVWKCVQHGSVYNA